MDILGSITSTTPVIYYWHFHTAFKLHCFGPLLLFSLPSPNILAFSWFLFYTCVVIVFSVQVCVCVKSLKLFFLWISEEKSLFWERRAGEAESTFRGICCMWKGAALTSLLCYPPGRQCHIQTMYPRVSLAQGGSCPHSQREVSWRNRQRFPENSRLKYCPQWAC